MWKPAVILIAGFVLSTSGCDSKRENGAGIVPRELASREGWLRADSELAIAFRDPSGIGSTSESVTFPTIAVRRQDLEHFVTSSRLTQMRSSVIDVMIVATDNSQSLLPCGEWEPVFPAARLELRSLKSAYGRSAYGDGFYGQHVPEIEAIDRVICDLGSLSDLAIIRTLSERVSYDSCDDDVCELERFAVEIARNAIIGPVRSQNDEIIIVNFDSVDLVFLPQQPAHLSQIEGMYEGRLLVVDEQGEIVGYGHYAGKHGQKDTVERVLSVLGPV